MSRHIPKIEPPAEYVMANLSPGDKVKCAGCNKEHTLLPDRNDEGKVDWAWTSAARAPLAKSAPVAAFVCTTQSSYYPSKRCLGKALKRMQRCTGCGRGPRDSYPEPTETWKDRKFPPVELGELCKWCEDALAAGNAALASRGEVTWRALVTNDLFSLEDRREEGAVPGDAFDSLREAARLMAKLAAGANLRSVPMKWKSPIEHDVDPPTVPPDTKREWHSSDEPLAEMDDATAELLTELGAAVGRAVSLAQEASKREGESILKALARANTAENPYEGLVNE